MTDKADLSVDAEFDPAKPGHYNLRLYVAGQTPKSLAAISNLKSICEEHLAGMYTIEVIDLLVKPQLAAGDQILAVPTLVRRLPPPIKRIIGSLSDTERVLVGLDIQSGEPPSLMSWPEPPAVQEYVLRLFVAGTTTRSQNAITNIRRICDQHLGGHFDLEVIDVYTHPEKTRDYQIVATPTLVKVSPQPLRRIVGDLSNRDRVLQGLNLGASGGLLGGARVSDADVALAAAQARIRELEAALLEANETFDAIRNGDVDAVVVGSARGQIVYTLENADRPYRVLVEQMREGAVTLDGQGTILYCNSSFAELVGARSEDIVGTQILNFVEDRAALETMLREAGPEGVSAELPLRLASGGVAETNLSVVNMVVEAGDAAMLCVIVTDLRANHERAREVAQANMNLASEIAVRARAEQSLAIALDAADMGSWDLDLSTDRGVRSARHDAIYGYAEPVETWGAREGVEHFLPEDRQAVLDAMAAAEITGRIDIERRIKRAGDGALRWVQVKGRTLYKDGKPERLIGIIVDNTERRQLDEALRQGQKMEAIGQLTGGIAHDFNNLLMIIGGSLESLSRRVQLDERGQKLLDGARLGVARGARLNEQLLAFARRQDMREEAISVTDLLPTFATLLDRAVGEATTVEVQSTADLWYCKTDPHQLETAILNLAINARDAMNDRGELRLSTANVEVSAQLAEAYDATPGDYVEVTVADTGPGMTPEIASRVFEPFFTTKGVGKGTGLGLSQVYGFARQSGGFVALETEPGKGTRFSIYLPRTMAPLAEVTEQHAVRPVETVEGIALLVEDDSDVRAATRSMLEELGYSVLEADSADRALTALDEGLEADLVFSDVIMASGMTGIELARAIKSRNPDLPVLLTSGYTAQRLVPNSGNDDLPLLRKPYTLSQLAEALGALTRR